MTPDMFTLMRTAFTLQRLLVNPNITHNTHPTRVSP